MNRLRFSANLGFLWSDRPLPARVYAAANAGFEAVECHWPYQTKPRQVLDALNATGLTMLALNTPPGRLDAGEFGLGAVSGRQKEAQEGVCRAVDYASMIGAKYIHAMAGICEDSRVALHRMYDHLAWAAEVARAADLDILIEPINRIDRPGYALFRVSQAIDLIHRLENQEGIRNIRLMFDCYHVQMTEGNLLTRLTEALPWIGHVQVAGVPGRHEPNIGEVDYDWLFKKITDLKYDGWIGAEYQSTGDTDIGLEWYQPFRSSQDCAPLKPPKVFRHFDQEGLDAEYNNRAKVPNFGEYLQWYIQRSQETRLELNSFLDISYGSSFAETLDIFYTGTSNSSGSLKPVHVFFHGGYWHALNKHEFSYVANATLGLDALCVVVNYALIPEVDMEELVTQCRRALIWLWHHVAEYGGDPGRIIVSGHSAGGHLTAMLSATDWPALEFGCPQNLVKGALIISGLMDLEPIRLCYLNDVLNLDEITAQRNSPALLENYSEAKIHCFYGDQEGEEYRRQSDALAARWDNATSTSLPGQDHFTICMMLDDPDSILAHLLRTMMERGPVTQSVV